MALMRKYNTKSAKLTTSQVQEMYGRLKNGELTQGEAARLYGLGVIQVGRIARGESRAQETGAHSDPIPNFNLQTRPEDVQASGEEMLKRLDAAQIKLTGQGSWYDQPPSTEDEDNAAAERGIAGLNEELKPTAKQQQVSDELDKLEKGQGD
jgi:hypothetical protein